MVSAVSIENLKVYDLSGSRILLIEDGFDELEDLESLQNGLYLYTVTVTLSDDSEEQSPVMKFLVKQ